MNPNWFEAQMKYDKVYPKEIRDLAAKLGVEEDEIAKSKGISPGTIGKIWIRRDEIEVIFRIQQDPLSPEESIVEFGNGTVLCLWDPKQNLWKKIDKFLHLEPTLEFKVGDPEMDPEEIAEMGADYEKE